MPNQQHLCSKTKRQDFHRSAPVPSVVKKHVLVFVVVRLVKVLDLGWLCMLLLLYCYCHHCCYCYICYSVTLLHTLLPFCYTTEKGHVFNASLTPAGPVGHEQQCPPMQIQQLTPSNASTLFITMNYSPRPLIIN